MTFKQAIKKMEKISKGEFHHLWYKYTSIDENRQRVECEVYMHGYSPIPAQTWEEAINILINLINGRSTKPILEGAPQGKSEKVEG